MAAELLLVVVLAVVDAVVVPDLVVVAPEGGHGPQPAPVGSAIGTQIGDPVMTVVTAKQTCCAGAPGAA